MQQDVKITWKNKFDDMAKGENAQKSGHGGKEWWGKRPLSNMSVSRNKGMKYWKKLLHKIERKQGKNQISDGNEI